MAASELLTVDAVISEIHRRAELAGSLRALARIWDICPGHLSRVVRRQKNPGHDILSQLGLQERVMYQSVATARNKRA